MPKVPPLDANFTNSNSSPAAFLLFVVWSLVPDFGTAERSKVVHSIYSYGSSGGAKRIYRNTNVGGLVPSGGNFLRLFGRREHVNKAIEKTGNTGFDALVDEFLFPKVDAGKQQVRQDAKLMVTRCSAPIAFNDS